MDSKISPKRQGSPEAKNESKPPLWMARIERAKMDTLYVLTGQLHLLSSCLSVAKEGLDLSLEDTLNLAILLEEAARETTLLLDEMGLAPDDRQIA